VSKYSKSGPPRRREKRFKTWGGPITIFWEDKEGEKEKKRGLRKTKKKRTKKGKKGGKNNGQRYEKMKIRL